MTDIVERLEELIVEREALRMRVKQLETRLEFDPECDWDGIDCRDETIKGLDAQIEALKAGNAGWQQVIEAAKFAVFCPDAGGYRDGRSMEDCYEELESAVNAYFGTDICAADLDWVSEDELNDMVAPKPGKPA